MSFLANVYTSYYYSHKNLLFYNFVQYAIMLFYCACGAFLFINGIVSIIRGSLAWLGKIDGPSILEVW
jgi:hypothetical protein